MNRAADQFSVPVCNQRGGRWQQLTVVYESRIRFRAKLCSEQFFIFIITSFQLKEKYLSFEALNQTLR